MQSPSRILWHFFQAAIAGGCLPAGVVMAAAVEFGRDIQPLLARRCLACHGPETQEAGLRLDDRARRDDRTRQRHDRDRAGRCRRAAKCSPGSRSTDPDIRMPPEGPRLYGRRDRGDPAVDRRPAPSGRPTGPFGRSSGRRCPPARPADRPIRSTPSSTPVSPPAACPLSRGRQGRRSCGGPRYCRHRPATDRAGDAGLSGRRLTGCLGAGGRPAARLAALRRALGPPLARPRPLRRDQLLRAGRRQAPCLAVSRLRDPRLQRRQALRPVRDRAARRRRAARAHRRLPDRHRLLPARPLGRRAGRQAPGPLRQRSTTSSPRPARRSSASRSTAPAATTTRSIRSRSATTTRCSPSSTTSRRWATGR